MISPVLQYWLTEAPRSLLQLLDKAYEPLQPAIRAEIFGSQHFSEYGRKLGEAHSGAGVGPRAVSFLPRLHSNIGMLRQVHDFIGLQANSGYHVSPAAEWLLDNFHHIEEQLDAIHRGLPLNYFRNLPVLKGNSLDGLPRIYGVAWSFVSHSDAAFDEELAIQFLIAYQQSCELRLGELWALPTTLRVVLIENLRRLAERVATNMAARQLANLCSDTIDHHPVARLNQLLELLNARGVGRVFLLQLAQRLLSRKTTGEGDYPNTYQDWLRTVLPVHLELEFQAQQSADQAADNVSVSNAVGSLRIISTADWPEIVDRTSALTQLMGCSELFKSEDIATRDQTLHAIERFSWRSGQSELRVARELLELMHKNEVCDYNSSTSSYWLDGPGRAAMARTLGLHDRAYLIAKSLASRLVFPVYMGALALGTAGLVLWMQAHYSMNTVGATAPWYWTLLITLFLLFPASEAVIALTNRLVSESKRPKILPRLALRNGIPPEHRVLVAIPCMLTSTGSVHGLLRRIELHYLANPEPHAQFALLSDWADAEKPHCDLDDSLLAFAVSGIRELNLRYPPILQDGAMLPRFIVLHRARTYCQTEQRWLGWERKRGKLEQLIAALAQGTSTDFLDLGAESRIAGRTPYVVTLDSDTVMPPGRLRELVGVAAHPHNRPRLDAQRKTVLSGYGILQPHISTPLPGHKQRTPFHWLFSGQCGIDPYSAASSEVYQDLFLEGSFTGKGLLNVEALHAVLVGRLPQNQVLSHDLLEGSLARCATVSDIPLLEEAPSHADVSAMRLHRWIRGDWQLLPFLLSPKRSGLSPVNWWKMLDNLRRSLVPPMSLVLVVSSLFGNGIEPYAALTLVFSAFSAGPLMGAAAGFLTGDSDSSRTYFFHHAWGQLARAMGGALWHMVQLLTQALLATDAILRVLYRLLISKRHLLQWTTAESAQAHARTDLVGVLLGHWKVTVSALALAASLVTLHTPHLALSMVLCLIWGTSALVTWWASRPTRTDTGLDFSTDDQDYLHGVARDTWRFFERSVGPQDLYLPPDNLQISPQIQVAHRTSPTNIGMYLLSAACARSFGWIGTQDFLSRMESTINTLSTLRRHRGHFLNWYDTQTGLPLAPMYVSTVDSGNLCGHLLTLAKACRELANEPAPLGVLQSEVDRCKRRLAPLLLQYPHFLEIVPSDSALKRVLAMPAPLTHYQDNPGGSLLLLDAALAELKQLAPLQEDPALSLERASTVHLSECIDDLLGTLRSACKDILAMETPPPRPTALRLQAVAQTCEDFANEAEFGFLYHPKRHLLHIGYRVDEDQLDAGFYDLLASESRLTSLLAIAKGDVPARHWSALGRPYYASGSDLVMRSWSGSMFEYLMPTLVLHEPSGSVLHASCRAALKEQIEFARLHGVPWGISECAYAGRDHTLAYQYAPHGVPRLALRRTPADELVVAPYATALAAQIAPHTACRNFESLQALGARGRYGFIESLDFSSIRRTGNERCIPVVTYMAHHQGMSIVALANVLMDGLAQHWAMSNASFEAVDSLLQERPPRDAAPLPAPHVTASTHPMERRAAGLLRTVVPDEVALQPTLILSNGRYSTVLRANGSGTSSWDQIGISRNRDDALRDIHGHFFYLRRSAQECLVSITQHPAPDPEAVYTSTYHADRMCFEANWPTLLAHTEIWVSPEDDIEFRSVELQNLGEVPIEIELLSAFEVTLSDARADEAHPAFTNLFVRAHWLVAQQALVFERKPRLSTDRRMLAAHFLAHTDAQILDIGIQTDRQRWIGRNRSTANPVATLEAPPSAGAAQDSIQNTGLDPVSVVAIRIRIAPAAKAQLTFATTASDDSTVLHAVIDKYRQSGNIRRASAMSATLAAIRLRALRISAENFAAFQSLTTALTFILTRTPMTLADASAEADAQCDRRLLWRFGISGDRPLILVSAGAPQGEGMLRGLAQALSLWSWGRVPCDLVVINAEPVSYQMALQRELTLLCERHVAESTTQPGAACTVLHTLRAEEISTDELSTLRILARVRLDADGRPLSHHVQEWVDKHAQAQAKRANVPAIALPQNTITSPAVAVGSFSPDGADFRFETGNQLRPMRPWTNVMANPDFGAHLTESGGGYTWAGNSRMNQLTAWSNDPVSDPAAEWFLLQDRDTHQVWNVAPGSVGSLDVTYQITHRQGCSTIAHHYDDLQVAVDWCIDAHAAVKQVRIMITNHGTRQRNLRLIGMVEWMMGENRGDRGSVHTSIAGAVKEMGECAVLLCTQREYSNGFGGGTAFFSLTQDANELVDWTCDRREFLDSRGAMVVPERLGKLCGEGLDPCAALSTAWEHKPGELVEHVFLLGYGNDLEIARQLSRTAAAIPAQQRQQQSLEAWNALLGATTVHTPDPLFDALVNRWLLYQTVSCRMWAKSGFYQAGGATGFRDQLQDAMALAWAAPARLREQIVRCASRQFVEGDVQHWWHEPTGAGVRTHFSDDLLWLAHACEYYVRATGDDALLEELVPFLEGPAIREGNEDAYYCPTLSADQASVYEHAARAIDCSLRVGSHGLPLMGTGDWNDGMNRVGHEGRGESVWLGWFLCNLVTNFVPMARARGDDARAIVWEAAIQGWTAALLGPSWDGQWFKRAFFDNGQALGSHENTEARIDLIAQAWAVLSHVAPVPLQRAALNAIEKHLVDGGAGLIRLLDPPLAESSPSAGYVQAYPPGVRENGGQYSHAGVWALMAVAEFARNNPGNGTPGDTCYRYFRYLSPAHRANDPAQGSDYLLEPFVMAGDVYSQAPYVGRGGWSWYTGAAAWLHRAAVGSIFGLQQDAHQLSVTPCLPSHWRRAELTLTREGRSIRFILLRATPTEVELTAQQQQAAILQTGQPVRWLEQVPQACYVVPLSTE